MSSYSFGKHTRTLTNKRPTNKRARSKIDMQTGTRAPDMFHRKALKPLYKYKRIHAHRALYARMVYMHTDKANIKYINIKRLSLLFLFGGIDGGHFPCFHFCLPRTFLAADSLILSTLFAFRASHSPDYTMRFHSHCKHFSVVVLYSNLFVAAITHRSGSNNK